MGTMYMQMYMHRVTPFERLTTSYATVQFPRSAAAGSTPQHRPLKDRSRIRLHHAPHRLPQVARIHRVYYRCRSAGANTAPAAAN